MIGIGEKAVVAVATRTPAPIFIGVSILVIAIILVVAAINFLGCTNLTTTPSWSNLISLKEQCDLSRHPLEGILTFVGALIVF